MSGRHKKSWDTKAPKMPPAEFHRDSSPKRSNSEANDSARASWDRNMSKDDDIIRGRPRKQTYSSFDDKCSRPSDDRYNQSYRNRDRDGNRSRSRSRSRGREWESRNEDRHKSNEYTDTDSRVCKDFVAGDCRKGSHCRFFHSRGSKYSDYRNSSRSMGYDTYEKGNQVSNDFIKGRSNRGSLCRSPHRDDRKPYQSSRPPCKFFIAGNCNRDNCKFSHDGPDPRSHDNHNSDNVLPDMSKASFSEKNKSWDGPSWERSHDNNGNNRTWDRPVSDDKKKLWDGPSWDDLDSQGFGDKNDNVLSDDKNITWVSEKKLCDERSRDSDVKNRTWDGPVSRRNSDDKKKSWDGPSWDDHDSRGFDERSRDDDSNVRFNDKNRTWGSQRNSDDNEKLSDERSRDKKGNVLSDDKNRTWDRPVSRPDFDDKKKAWDGPSWNDHDSRRSHDNNDNVLFDDKNRTWGSQHNSDDNEKSRDERSRDKNGNLLSDDKNRTWDHPVSRPDFDDKKKAWDGPSWNDHDSRRSHDNNDNVLFDDKNRTWGSRHNSKDNEKLRDERSRDKNGNVLPDDKKKWDGPSWDDLDVRSHGNNVNVLSDDKNRTWVSEKKSCDERSRDKNSSVLSDDKNRTRDRPVSMHDSDDKEKSCDERSHDKNSNVLSDDKKRWDGPSWDDLDVRSSDNHGNIVSDDMNRQLDCPVSRDDKKNLRDDSDLNNSNVLSEDANQQVVTCGKDSMDSQPKKDQKGELPEVHLTKPIDYFPKSAYNQEGNIGNGKKEENIDPKNPEGERKVEESNIGNGEKEEGEGKVGEGNVVNEEKLMRQFKIGLVELVKEILKPKWKEGKMGKEVYKTVVKKVVDKVTSSIQGIQIPRTQPKIEQYLASSKPKITKLVDAYVERLLKA